MTWMRIDDQFPDHPKVMAAGPLAGWLFVCGLGYCARQLTDGFIPEAQVRKLADLKNAGREAQRLVDAGLWERVDGGYQVHDYLDYQPSAEKVLGDRSAAQERMRRRRSENVRPNIERSSHSPTPTRPVNEGSNEPSTPPTPPSQPTPIRPAPKSSSPPSESGYERTLNGAMPKAVAKFSGLHMQLNEPWLRETLSAAEKEIGPLPRDKIGRGLELALDQMRRSLAGGKVATPRGLARKFIVDYLREQAQ